MNQNATATFIGHRHLEANNELNNKIEATARELICIHDVTVFLFGSKSEFNDLCYSIITKLKMEYPNIARIYVRAEYEFINTTYTNYLLQFYEKTYFPIQVINAGRLSYVKRNQVMIDSSDYVVIHYDEKNAISTLKSGTKIAYEYALKKKNITNLFHL